MGTADPWCDDADTAGSAPSALLRAAVALRWNRPDLTATLAELALEAATDVDGWVVAAGWLLHGRVALGDGRDTVCELLDGLDRWGAAGVERMTGPVGRRLRIEMAGPVRRIGEPALARALLSSEPGVDDDPQLHADVLTELARCAVDDAPDTADDALTAAEQAWQAAACAPGVAAVVLLRAARNRRAGRADVAVVEASGGLEAVNASGRRLQASDHVAAALTAEWIAALVDAGRADEAREGALSAANRLIATARASRQIAGLRLALARLAAVADGADVVLAALEPAAQDAADSDVPELESACRSMLGELHEHAGRLDAALSAVRAAMVAERRDRDRGARLRARCAVLAASWAARPSSGVTTAQALQFGGTSSDLRAGRDAGTPGRGGPDEAIDPWSGEDGPDVVDGSTRGGAHPPPPPTAEPTVGRRARRRAAELVDDPDDAGRPTDGGPFAASRPESSVRRDAAAPGRWSAVGGWSLIGDALLHELTGGNPTPRDVPPSADPRQGRGVDDAADDPTFDAEGRGRRHRGGSGLLDATDLLGPGSGTPADGPATRAGVDVSAMRWDRTAWVDRAAVADTVVFDVAADGSVDPDGRSGRPSQGPRHGAGPGAGRPAAPLDGAGRADGSGHASPARVDRARNGGLRPGRTPRDGGAGRPSDTGPTADPAAGYRNDRAPRPGGAADGPRSGGATGRDRPPVAADDRSGRRGRAGRSAHDEPDVAGYRWVDGRPVDGAGPERPAANGIPPVHGAPANAPHLPGAHAKGAPAHGAEVGARNDDGRDVAGGRPDHGVPVDHRAPGPVHGPGPVHRPRPAHGDAGHRGSGRPPSTDADGLGLADLLAGALAAYRDL